MDNTWKDLGREEKRAARLKHWLTPPDVTFSSHEAEEGYRKRVNRFIKAIGLEKPDRVPVILPAHTYPLYHSGLTLKEVMYDNIRLCQAYRKFFQDFEGDTYISPLSVPSGRALEIVNRLTLKWPGHGLPNDASLQQFVEGEYMKADEYDIFINDLSDYFLRYYLPRSLGALAPMAAFRPLPHMFGFASSFLMPAIMTEVRAMYQAIIDYGKEMDAWMKPLIEFDREAQAAGYPSLYGGQTHAPFDILADTLRGTRGIVMDMYRQPEKLLKAMEKLTQINIDCGLQAANASGRPVVVFALHKGDDSFMSSAQYEKFYWPTFRKVIIALIEDGCVPFLFAEGRYDNRLEIVKDLPKGKVVWQFDRTDMFKAKKILGDTACIAGNVPSSLLCTGKPAEVKDYCRRLIEVCGEGGGFILTGGASMDKGDPGNLWAMMEAAVEYGVYK